MTRCHFYSHIWKRVSWLEDIINPWVGKDAVIGCSPEVCVEPAPADWSAFRLLTQCMYVLSAEAAGPASVSVCQCARPVFVCRCMCVHPAAECLLFINHRWSPWQPSIKAGLENKAPLHVPLCLRLPSDSWFFFWLNVIFEISVWDQRCLSTSERSSKVKK